MTRSEALTAAVRNDVYSSRAARELADEYEIAVKQNLRLEETIHNLTRWTSTLSSVEATPHDFRAGGMGRPAYRSEAEYQTVLDQLSKMSARCGAAERKVAQLKDALAKMTCALEE